MWRCYRTQMPPAARLVSRDRCLKRWSLAAMSIRSDMMSGGKGSHDTSQSVFQCVGRAEGGAVGSPEWYSDPAVGTGGQCKHALTVQREGALLRDKLEPHERV
jgi:hypothetical protein